MSQKQHNDAKVQARIPSSLRRRMDAVTAKYPECGDSEMLRQALPMYLDAVEANKAILTSAGEVDPTFARRKAKAQTPRKPRSQSSAQSGQGDIDIAALARGASASNQVYTPPAKRPSAKP
jgi:hypothetical protein